MYQKLEQQEQDGTPKPGYVAVIQFRSTAGSPPRFCQTKEQERIFRENNPSVKFESFPCIMSESSAREKIDDPENVKQFVKKEN